MIKNIYNLGIPLETIAKASKLSLHEIEHILGHNSDKKSLNSFKLFLSTLLNIIQLSLITFITLWPRRKNPLSSGNKTLKTSRSISTKDFIIMGYPSIIFVYSIPCSNFFPLFISSIMVQKHYARLQDPYLMLFVNLDD